jgi:transposase-like protein
MKMKKLRGKPLIYSNELKIAVAREYLTSNLGYGRLAEKHGLSRATVAFIVKWYKATYPEGEVKTTTEEQAPSGDSSELAALRRQLKEAQLKIAGYETMMSIAQKELDIDIVKKFGTKQSGK